jgi:branched-chain amino acid transport system ATP-binding protein
VLELQRVTAGYGDAVVISDLTLRIAAGEVVALLGRNGMGKTTTVRTIMGQVAARSGQITYGETNLLGLPPNRIARLGVGLVPEGRQIFHNLTVEENLVATQARPRVGGRGVAWSLDTIYDLFPALRSRSRNMGNELSGGEQQMLAIGRALMTNPTLLILDEATEGLAPLIRKEIWQILKSLRETGLSILVIDKDLDALAALADRCYVMIKGRVDWQGSVQSLLTDSALRSRTLGVL